MAWDLQRGDWRTFRVDRVARPFANGVRFAPRELPAEDAAAYVAQALRALPQRHTAVLTVALPLAEAAERIPAWMGELTAAGDRSVLRTGADSPGWLALMIAMLDIEATVDASPELMEQLRALQRRVGRLTRG